MSYLRVAFITGSLGKGGAEKQLVYMAKSLKQINVNVKIYCLTSGEFYEKDLIKIGIKPIYIGRIKNPVWRLVKIGIMLNNFRPHIIQSIHFYTNLYTSIISRTCSALGVGSIRSDAYNEVDSNAFWGKYLLSQPRAIITNSNVAKRNAILLGAQKEKIYVLRNAIDIEKFDIELNMTLDITPFKILKNQINVIIVSNLVKDKRIDRYLYAIFLARKNNPKICGIIIGEGEERQKLEKISLDLNLLPEGVQFLGSKNNIPSILRFGDIFVLTSDHEGFPNVILEAMSASLPIISTPAGEVVVLVKNDVNGYIVQYSDTNKLAERICYLASCPALREKLGKKGRKQVENKYSINNLTVDLLGIYEEIAKKNHKKDIIASINRYKQKVI